MNQYVTGIMIKKLRENKRTTQSQLAKILGVSDKTVSKWETGRGYPDISLIKPLAEALGISVIELFSGMSIVNTNRTSDMLKAKFYVCPICGNIIVSTGEAVVSCCGISLPVLEAEQEDQNHSIKIERIEDEYYVTVPHEMSKTHYISFIAAISDDGCDIKKLYPQAEAASRFKMSKTEFFYYYCNKHGLYKFSLK